MANGLKVEIRVPDADGLFDLAAARRELRGWVFAQSSGDARRAARARLPSFDLHPSQFGGLFHLPFPHAVSACTNLRMVKAPAFLFRMRWMRSRRSRQRAVEPMDGFNVTGENQSLPFCHSSLQSSFSSQHNSYASNQ